MVKQNSTKAWLLASRPKTLTAASIPVMLGCALASMYGHFQLIPAILCFLFAFLMQIDANFINDLYDYLKGSDREDRLGPERACAQGWISPSGMKKGFCNYCTSCSNRAFPPWIWWLGNDSSRYCLYYFCFPIYYWALSACLSWLGRYTGSGILRVCTCWMYFLCNGT